MFKLCLKFFVVGQLILASAQAQDKPNVVLVLTDDQGYGDLACHGHPYIQTPNIDKLFSESVSLYDYHVFPTCSPSRSALMTGHWANRTGVWHTVNGRSLLRKNEITVATMLKKAGYETGMFGKWHLGDNYPFRPEDRGFTEVYRHGAGGVGQTPDVWDNAYFDGSYFHNGEIVPAKGFCTDVFFREGNRFIRESVAKKKPFFAYISLNAPHSPLHCPEKYTELYKDKKKNLASFYGMITNIDENVGKTRALLTELGVENNTVFIFTTDNGTAAGSKVFNAGMKGKKNSEYDGGHRVPFILHWPAGKMAEKKVVKTLTHAVDLTPTLLDLCGGSKPEGTVFDGMSILPLLKNGDSAEWSDRMLITDSQRVVDPIKWRKSAVMKQDWRLVNGEELYHIAKDPGQENDLAKKHPEIKAEMRAFYEAWWKELEPTFKIDARFPIGNANAPEVKLTGHDWITAELPAWNQAQMRNLSKFFKKEYIGYWPIDVEKAGKYNMKLRRWPNEVSVAASQGLPSGKGVPGSSRAFREVKGEALDIVAGVIKLDGKLVARKEYKAGDQEISIDVEMAKGIANLSVYFELADGMQVGVGYLNISHAK